MSEQKSDKDKAEQAWRKYSSGRKRMALLHDFKSSLKRDIEKRIELKVKEINDSKDPIQKTALAIRTDECKYFLELIETVEP